MTAIACMRVFVGEGLAPGAPETTAASVGKIASAYLESTWAWPRRHGQVAPLAFVLADPRVTHLDERELQQLAADLHLRLFGRQGLGEVNLLTLEGAPDEILKFASTDARELTQLLSGKDNSQFSGRICKITPFGVVSVAPPGASVDGGGPAPALEQTKPSLASAGAGVSPPAPAEASAGASDAAEIVGNLRVIWLGLYHAPSERFVGSGMAFSSEGLTDGDEVNLPRELSHLALSREIVTSRRLGGYLFTPLNFSSLCRLTSRAACHEKILQLPNTCRGRMGAQVYNVPREPSFGSVQQIRTLLADRFSLIHIYVRDPGFAIEGLPVGMVNTVVLELDRRAGEHQRLAAVTRFLSNAHGYRNKRASQGVAGVRTAKELELCLQLKATFLSGEYIAPGGPLMLGDKPWPAQTLPYRG